MVWRAILIGSANFVRSLLRAAELTRLRPGRHCF